MDKHELLHILRIEGFEDRIVNSFNSVKREDFIHSELRRYAYDNKPLPIGHGQTISQPSTIAFMLRELELKDNLNILEIGSGSGYVLALINELSRDSKIIGIERIKLLAEQSKELLKKHKNIQVIHYNGFDGYKKEPPYDRILVSASAEQMNDNIINQLSEDGIAVMPIKKSIVKIKKIDGKIYQTEFYGFIFVPLVDDS